MASPLASSGLSRYRGAGLRPFYAFGSDTALPPQKIICYWIFSAIFHMKIRISLQTYFMIILAGNRFFRIFGKTGPRIRNFFSLKPPRDQDGANRKKFRQIGPAVPEELGNIQTHRLTHSSAFIE